MFKWKGRSIFARFNRVIQDSSSSGNIIWIYQFRFTRTGIANGPQPAGVGIGIGIFRSSFPVNVLSIYITNVFLLFRYNVAFQFELLTAIRIYYLVNLFVVGIHRHTNRQLRLLLSIATLSKNRTESVNFHSPFFFFTFPFIYVISVEDAFVAVFSLPCTLRCPRNHSNNLLSHGRSA